MESIYLKRIKNLLDIIEKDNINTILVFNSSDVYYLTGFNDKEDNSLLIISKDFKIFITDGRFINQFKDQVNNFDLICRKEKSLFTIAKEILIKNNISNVYIPYDQISYKNFIDLQDKKLKFYDSSKIILNLRRTKDDTEIEYIKKACEISEKAFLNILDKIFPGMSEIEIKNILEKELYNQGAQDLSFPTIIASGKINGAKPHAIPSNRTIKKGDFITIDFGATYNHYHADITRTIAIGKINNKQKDIYKKVYEAKNIAEDFINNNKNCKDIHNQIDEYFKNDKHQFLHGLGHGLGLEIHESPTLNSKSKEILKNNDVFTIEPGIYETNICGVRIENNYFIKNNELICLTKNITNKLINI